MSNLIRPRDLSHALALMAEGDARALAGGTDLYPATDRPELSGPLVDLTVLDCLKGIAPEGDSLRIGACTTWAEIARAPLPPALSALREAAAEIGGRQIQNAGTIGGNLCNASPAADGVPPLLACDAEVEVGGRSGVRRVPLADFLTGPRRTALLPGEILKAVILPASGLTGVSRFLKLGARAYLVISIAMVAVRFRVADGRIAAAALSVGSCGPTARRLPEVEAELTGAKITGAPDRVDAAAVAAALSPISDPRASAGYRVSAATELIRRAVAGLTEMPA
ncbi:MAG: xanthine dehydrogenase family protein subunit M [Paracoccaceae bacterium]|nr:MAG: xanthine dehydrogenase family protein subunit M [Paracoccaceae bacterium]